MYRHRQLQHQVRSKRYCSGRGVDLQCERKLHAPLMNLPLRFTLSAPDGTRGQNCPLINGRDRTTQLPFDIPLRCATYTARTKLLGNSFADATQSRKSIATPPKGRFDQGGSQSKDSYTHLSEKVCDRKLDRVTDFARRGGIVTALPRLYSLEYSNTPSTASRVIQTNFNHNQSKFTPSQREDGRLHVGQRRRLFPFRWYCIGCCTEIQLASSQLVRLL